MNNGDIINIYFRYTYINIVTYMYFLYKTLFYLCKKFYSEMNSFWLFNFRYGSVGFI